MISKRRSDIYTLELYFKTDDNVYIIIHTNNQV
jgi:hypothetical protein